MAAIGSLVFCTACGNLLAANTIKRAMLTCDVCYTENLDTSNKVIITTSKPSAFPSTLRTRLRSDVADLPDQKPEEASIAVACPKCGALEVRYHERQLRSADEGSTIFYTCPKCFNKWNENN